MQKALRSHWMLCVMLMGNLLGSPSVSAQTVAAQKTKEILADIKPSISAIYSRSVAGRDSAYYSSVLAGRLGLSYALPQEATLSLSTGFSRDQDALEERNIWSSTSLVYVSRPYELIPDYQLEYSGTLIAPTNSDSREYLSYRGSLGLDASFGRDFSKVPLIQKLNVSLTGGAIRNFFTFDSSIAGDPNTTAAINGGVAVAVTVHEKLSLSSSFSLEKSLKSNGSWSDPSYKHSIAASTNLADKITLSLSESTENRAFSYDYETTQIALYDYQTTVYELKTTYNF